MNNLFGIPMETILWVFVVLFAAILGIVAVFAVRSRIFLKLAFRSASRRAGRTALIVVGLMLGTTIITAAFTTGDTMSYTIRSEVLDALGNTDEVISRQGAELGASLTVQNPADIEYFSQDLYDDIERAADGSENIDGMTPAIIETVGIQDLTSQQTEPRATIFAPDPTRMEGFGEIGDVEGGTVELADLAPGEVYLNRDAADELLAAPGDEIVIYAAQNAHPATVRAIVEYNGAATTESAILMPLAAAQQVLEAEGMIKHVLVSNTGDEMSGMALTDEVIAELEPTLTPLRLEADPTKRDSIDLADETGDGFLTIFVTFGSFSVIAGMLLIFLIFVMLAQERKGEMGVARAIGAQRRHLAESFTFEGVAYDVLAALVGAVAGIAIALAMVTLISQALGDIGASIHYNVEPRSVVVAYIIGMLVTFIVVAVSAWRVSALNIVRAIRDLPEPQTRAGDGKGWLIGPVAMAFGALLAYAGADSRTAAPLYLGVSLVIIGSVPLLRRIGIADRAAYTLPGLALVIYWLLPFDTFYSNLSMDFSLFILSGIFVVTGATWIVIYNSDILIGHSTAFLSRIRGLAPILKTAVAYPLINRFRTGLTLAMFTLVVFTMVVMSITITSFGEAFDDVESFGGGYDVRATTVSSNPIMDPEQAIADAPDLNPENYESIARQSAISVRARQDGFEDTKEYADYPILGFDDVFLTDNAYRLATRASGYESDREVWEAIRDNPGYAIVSQDAVQRRQNWGFAPGLPDFRLEGFYIEDRSFEPVGVDVVDPQTNTFFTLTVIGVLSDAGPFFMTGITTSQQKLDQSVPGRAEPTTLWFRLTEGIDAEDTAERLEAAFLANGMEANALAKELADAVELNRMFNYIIQGFMGLGLIVGAVAIGVISARAVVERRQQIGVLRSIGFQKSAVQLSFLIESSLVALIGIVVGTGLGLIVAYDLIDQASGTGSWANLRYVIPVRDFAIMFTLVYGAALLASWFPARQASRVYPADALRYE